MSEAPIDPARPRDDHVRSVAAVPSKRGRSFERTASIVMRLIGFVILIALAVTFVLPFLWQVLLSFSGLADVDRLALLGVPPEVKTTETQFFGLRFPVAYPQVFETIEFGKAFFNSFLVAGWVTLLQVVTSAMAAFAFSRVRWPGRDKLFLLYLATMMIPGVVLMVPNFAVILGLGMFNTYAGLIIPAAFSAYGTFLMRQFMLTIPSSLDEAASIDGAGSVRIFLDVILPLSRPGLIVLTIFTFLGNYNSFFWPLVLIKDDNLRTLPIALRAFDSTYGTETPALMAASLMAMIPPIIIFIFLQRYLVKGIQLGAVKG
ncbi:MAG: carbohydrate ABC transporter permease [Planctomycetota bacterium]